MPTDAGRSRPIAAVALAAALLLLGFFAGVLVTQIALVLKDAPEARPKKAVRHTPIDRSRYPIGRSENGNRGLYLDLMKHSLTDLIHENDPLTWTQRLDGSGGGGGRAVTMIGLERLDNLQRLAEDVIERGIPGDMIEAGAWRGGATILMRAVLKAHDSTDRLVWVADSFEGLPPPDVENYPADEGMDFSEDENLAVPVEIAKENFERYGLLDEQVKFLKGWFKDTLPNAPIEKLSVLRIDADLYESTTDALVYLYPKLVPGGYVIVDDYGCFQACKSAVHDYRQKYGIDEEIVKIDWTGVYWQKNVERQ